MKDAYQQAVEYLTENYVQVKPWAHFGESPIGMAWGSPRGERGGCLFLFAKAPSYGGDRPCGCLTMIRNPHVGHVAQTDELTIAIASDGRLPGTWQDITVDHLPIFAGWQRRIDQILGRTPPPLDPRLPAPKGDIEIPAIEYAICGGSPAPASAEPQVAAWVSEQTPAGGTR